MKFADETFERQVLSNPAAAEKLRAGYIDACAEMRSPGSWRYERPITLPIMYSLGEFAGFRFFTGSNEPVIVKIDSEETQCDR